MKLTKTNALIALAAMMLPLSAQANLLINGSFEDTGGITLTNAPPVGNSTWGVFNGLPGWFLDDGSGIEIQSGINGGAHDGFNFVELDSHYFASLGVGAPGQTNSYMSQTLSLDPGTYELSFYYRPRTDKPDDNVISLIIGGTTIDTIDQTSISQTDWSPYSYSFEISDIGLYIIAFSAGGAENTLGGFLDDVQLIQTSSPAPSPEVTGLMLGGLGLLGFAALRRK